MIGILFFLASALLYICYTGFILLVQPRDITSLGMNLIIRERWVRNAIAEHNVVSVQTLRNHIIVCNNNAYFALMTSGILGVGVIMDTLPNIPQWGFLIISYEWFRPVIFAVIISFFHNDVCFSSI